MFFLFVFPPLLISPFLSSLSPPLLSLIALSPHHYCSAALPLLPCYNTVSPPFTHRLPLPLCYASSSSSASPPLPRPSSLPYPMLFLLHPPMSHSPLFFHLFFLVYEDWYVGWSCVGISIYIGCTLVWPLTNGSKLKTLVRGHWLPSLELVFVEYYFQGKDPLWPKNSSSPSYNSMIQRSCFVMMSEIGINTRCIIQHTKVCRAMVYRPVRAVCIGPTSSIFHLLIVAKKHRERVDCRL